MKRSLSCVIVLCLLISSLIFSNQSFAAPDIGIKIEADQPTGEKFDIIIISAQELTWVETETEEIISIEKDGFWYYNVIDENGLKSSNAKYKIDKKPQNAATRSELIKWREQRYINTIKAVGLNKTTLSIEVGQTDQLTATIVAEINPFLEDSIVWSSNDNSIVTLQPVDSFGVNTLVKAIAPGTAKIRATSKNAPSCYSECEVTVLEKAGNLKIDSRFNNAVVLLVNSNKAYVSGNETVIDSSNPSITPIIKNNKTLVPARFISEKLGASVGWNENLSTAIFRTGNKIVEITIGRNTMLVNNEEYALDVSAELINDRIYIPLRALVESLGKTVYYNQGLIIIAESEKTLGKELVDNTIALFNDTLNTELDLFPAVFGGKWGYIDNNGKIIIEPKYQDAMEFAEGLAPIALNGKYGYIDKKGKIIVEPKFDRVWKMSDGMGMVLLDKKCGFVDNAGKLVVEPKYDFGYTTFFSEGLACIGLDKKCGFIDKTGNIVIEPKFSLAFSFSEGLSAVMDKTSNKWGFIDKSGNYAIEPIYMSAFPFTEEVAPVQESSSGKWGYIDKSANYIIRPQFGGAGNFKEGMAHVRNSAGKAGYIDKEGKLIIDYKYETACEFSEGLAAVSIRDNASNTSKYGYINKSGDVVIDMNYLYVSNFKNGLAMVDIGYKTGYINKMGKYIWEPSEYSPYIR